MSLAKAQRREVRSNRISFANQLFFLSLGAFAPWRDNNPKRREVGKGRPYQLIKPVELSNVKLGWLPWGRAAVKVKVEGVGTLIVRVTPDVLR